MKKFFLIIAMTLAVITASAQDTTSQEKKFHIKPYGGLTLSKLFGNRSVSGLHCGFTAGLEGEYMATDKLAVSVGLCYTQEGGRVNETVEDGGTKVDCIFKDNFDYINVPILLNLYITKHLAFKVGMQPGYMVRSKFSLQATDGVENYNYESDVNVKKFDLAFPIGVSYEIANVVFDTRYNVGALNIINEAKDEEMLGHFTNGVFQITVGYRF